MFAYKHEFDTVRDVQPHVIITYAFHRCYEKLSKPSGTKNHDTTKPICLGSVCWSFRPRYLPHQPN